MGGGGSRGKGGGKDRGEEGFGKSFRELCRSFGSVCVT